ncbi:MAG: tRNA (N6-threonylcarbamoyladenosine(37)-N6)-methyltransferase TrmO [Clostridiales bacterium]|nr:tRNA (N6-threonylcarbamoyladenosine(37)-N6)-methyltransferase TrmO [Clostridiales bacterium]
MVINEIGVIHNCYTSKFGVPRQSGLIEEESVITFFDDYGDINAFKGIDSFNYIWVIWGFDKCNTSGWKKSVRPPKLGGNKRIGVFSTRSPYRPNSLGLTCVKLVKVDCDSKGGVSLTVSGGDFMDGTPVYDIKPYLKYADCREDASNGFALSDNKDRQVSVSESIIKELGEDKVELLCDILKCDPRPGYHNDDRIYGMNFYDYNIKFRFFENTVQIISAEKQK